MLKVNKQIRDEIQFYVDSFSTEVSGMGLVKKHADHFEVVKIFLPVKQKNTGATTELDQVDLNKLTYDLIKTGELDETTSLSFWWHSHVNMGVFWSGTDDENIRRNGSDGLFFSGVYNKKGDELYSVYAHNAINIGGIVSDYYDKNLKLINKQNENKLWQENVNAVKKFESSQKVDVYKNWRDDWSGFGDYSSAQKDIYFDESKEINKNVLSQIKKEISKKKMARRRHE